MYQNSVTAQLRIRQMHMLIEIITDKNSAMLDSHKRVTIFATEFEICKIYWKTVRCGILASNLSVSVPAWAILTTSEWPRSNTDTPLTAMTMSPTSSPLASAGVPGSMALTTTGLEPWIRKPNSPEHSRCLLLEEGVSNRVVEPGDVADVISELLRAVPFSVPESTCSTVA
nr:unnamed protein product [Callosobruchus analis]